MTMENNKYKTTRRRPLATPKLGAPIGSRRKIVVEFGQETTFNSEIRLGIPQRAVRALLEAMHGSKKLKSKGAQIELPGQNN